MHSIMGVRHETTDSVKEYPATVTVDSLQQSSSSVTEPERREVSLVSIKTGKQTYLAPSVQVLRTAASVLRHLDKSWLLYYGPPPCQRSGCPGVLQLRKCIQTKENLWGCNQHCTTLACCFHLSIDDGWHYIRQVRIWNEMPVLRAWTAAWNLP